jgi:hypothetical protein
MDSKLVGDISVYLVITRLLAMGKRVLLPVGDRLPFDVAYLDDKENLVKIEVKTAWFYNRDQAYIVQIRRMKTNRRVYRFEKYEPGDFDLLITVIQEPQVMYIFPSKVALSYANSISIVEGVKRQRKPKSADYREAWHLLP